MPTGEPSAEAAAALLASMTAATATPPAATSAAAPAVDPAAGTPAPVAREINDEFGQPVANSAELAASIGVLRQFGLDAGDEALLATGRPLTVTKEVRQRAETTRARLMADKAWVARYLEGDMAAQSLMMACNLRIAAATLKEG